MVDPALGAWSTVARSIVTTGTPVFTYFDANGAATTVAANVQNGQDPRLGRDRDVELRPGSSTYDTRVTLRPAA